MNSSSLIGCGLKKPLDFKNKTILDAGCGMGRNSYWCLKWGARKVVAFDKDKRSIAAARKTLAFPNAIVETHDIYNLPWRNKFDLALSIGVIHHLKDPARAVQQLRQTIKPGGELLLWVYSQVGFETTVKFLDPIRVHLTCKLPPRLLHALTYIISVPFYYIFLKLMRPTKPYYVQLRQFSVDHVHSIIFDQLLPDIANYYTKQEAINLLADFTDVTITTPPNGNGWIVRGKKPAVTPPR